ncbi:MAG: NAD(P)H-binding protein [Nitrososphaerota archaeon]
MRVFLAGASGAIGRQLVPLLVAAGHEVAGTTRREAKAGMLRELGAEPVVAEAARRTVELLEAPAGIVEIAGS